MVLVDTSVWVRFLGGVPPYLSDLKTLLKRDEVVGHELVYGELLMGDRGGRIKPLSVYSMIRHVGVVQHDEVVSFVRTRGLHGRGAGLIDVHLLAAAIVNGLTLWTTDVRLRALARELGIAYKGPFH